MIHRVSDIMSKVREQAALIRWKPIDQQNPEDVLFHIRILGSTPAPVASVNGENTEGDTNYYSYGCICSEQWSLEGR